MKIKYEFVTGDVEIEVDDEWGAVLLEEDRLLYNNDHRETRRHVSMDMMEQIRGVPFAAPIGKNELSTAMEAAISMLSPEQQALLRAIALEHVPVKAYAKHVGVDPTAISHRMRTIMRKLCKVLSDPQF